MKCLQCGYSIYGQMTHAMCTPSWCFDSSVRLQSSSPGPPDPPWPIFQDSIDLNWWTEHKSKIWHKNDSYDTVHLICIPEYKLSVVAGTKHFKNTRSAIANPAHTACKLPVTVGGGFHAPGATTTQLSPWGGVYKMPSMKLIQWQQKMRPLPQYINWSLISVSR